MIAWSYSRLKEFENCPLKFYLCNVSKEIPFVETEEMRRGNVLHTFLEKYIKNELSASAIPAELSCEVRFIDDLRKSKHSLVAEQKFCFDKKLSLVDWFYNRAWLRAKIDLIACEPYSDNLFVVDWKTGKVRHDEDQIKLMCCILFLVNKFERFICPSKRPLKQVSGCLMFIKDKEKSPIYKMTAESFEKTWEKFVVRAYKIKRAHITAKWLATPNKLCPWCNATCAQCKFKGN